MSEDKNHSEELLRYLRGEMTNDEAHDFERRALTDPFLQDALGGAEMISAEEFERDLTDIEKKNQAKHRPKTLITWRIAAVISLLMVSGITFWVVQDINRPEEISQTNSPEKEELGEISPTSNDTASEKKEEIIAFDQEESKPTNLPQPVAARQPEKPNNSQSELSVKSEEPEPIVIEDNRSDEIADQTFTQDEVQDKPIEALTLSKSSAAKRSFAPKKSPANDSIEADSFFASEEDEEVALQEVVVSGYGDYDNEPDGFVDAYPRPDYRTFKQYLEENLQYPEAAKNQGVKGRVILQLTISPTGSITNIEVKRSLGSGCDEEAIRLIEEGPSWEPASRDGINVESRIRVRVKFDLD